MIVGVETFIAEAGALTATLLAFGAASAARNVAQGLPRTSRQTQQQRQAAKAERERKAGQGARQKRQSRLAASSTDPATAPTGRGVLGGPPPQAAGPITPSTAPTSGAGRRPVLSSGATPPARPRPALVASRLPRPPSTGPRPPPARGPGGRGPGPGGGGGISLGNVLLAGGAARTAIEAFQEQPREAESAILRDPDALQRERDRRRAERQRGGRRGTVLSPSLGSVSELVSERATLLGR